MAKYTALDKYNRAVTIKPTADKSGFYVEIETRNDEERYTLLNAVIPKEEFVRIVLEASEGM